MQFWKQLPLAAFCLLFTGSFEASASSVESLKTPGTGVVTIEAKPKSYREWKSEQVQDALTRVTVVKTKIQLVKSKDANAQRRRTQVEATSGVNIEELEAQLQQDQTVLEMAKDLSVTDYFVGYLTKLQDKKTAFNEVAGKLTAEEVAELMAAYANSVFGTHTPDMAPSAVDLSSERVR